jgi:arylsulfatase A-like enzyme
VIDESRAIPPDLATLAEALQSEGWTTAAFTEGGALAAELGFGRGFHVFDEGSAGHVSPENADALERATRWLDRHSEHPAFLFVHTYRTRPVHTGADARVESVHRRELAAMVEQVRSADAAVGKLLATLEGRAIEDQSLYVLTSGHGEEFFEHGAAGHGTHLYEETMRVPLLMRGSKLARRRPQAVVGLLDVAPTILDLVGVPVPRSMQGMSFSRIVRGQKPSVAVPMYCEARRPLRLLADGTLQEWGGAAFAVRENDLKLIVDGSGKKMQAYDLSRDPREQDDLFASGVGPDWARRLARNVAAYRDLAQRQAAQAPRASLTEDNRRRLRSLGYLQ